MRVSTHSIASQNRTPATTASHVITPAISKVEIRAAPNTNSRSPPNSRMGRSSDCRTGTVRSWSCAIVLPSHQCATDAEQHRQRLRREDLVGVLLRVFLCFVVSFSLLLLLS